MYPEELTALRGAVNNIVIKHERSVKMNKELFEMPVMQVVLFNDSDIIRTSADLEETDAK